MKILIVGVSGFIGQHLYYALQEQGYKLTGCSRKKVSDINWRACDFSQSSTDWEQQLSNIDVVINAVGLYQQTDKQSFLQVHNLGAKKLFDACRTNGIRVIQISAAGAELSHPVTDFLKSKRNADQYLLSQNLPHIVLYPGIVLGEGGRSTHQFSLLAQMFLIPIIFGKRKKLPLISIGQLTQYIINLLNNWPEKKQSVVLIAKPESMENLLNNLRQWTGLGKARFVYFFEGLINPLFIFFPGLSIGVLNKQSIDMLAAYSSETHVPISNETASASLLKNRVSNHFKKKFAYTFCCILTLWH